MVQSVNPCYAAILMDAHSPLQVGVRTYAYALNSVKRISFNTTFLLSKVKFKRCFILTYPAGFLTGHMTR